MKTEKFPRDRLCAALAQRDSPPEEQRQQALVTLSADLSDLLDWGHGRGERGASATARVIYASTISCRKVPARWAFTTRLSFVPAGARTTQASLRRLSVGVLPPNQFQILLERP